jgi:hypothetical protein
MSKKDAYIEKAQAKIDEYAAKIEVLKSKSKGDIAGKKIVAYEQIEKLDTKLSAAKMRLVDLSESAGDTWEGLSGRLEELAEDLGVSIKKLIDKYK